MRLLLVPVLAVGLLAGCGGSPSGVGSPGARPAGTASAEPAWASCDAVGAPSQGPNPAEALTLPRLGPDFVPTAVVVCQLTPERRADGGQDLLAVEGLAGAPDDVAAVLTAVRLPDESRTPGACTSDLPGVPWFALVDGSGRWVRPGVPADACGKIRIEVRQAVERLTLRRVAARPVRELESSGAAASGCVQQWADIVWVTGQTPPDPLPGPPPAGREDPFAAGAGLRVCVYGVPPAERGGGKPAGTFERGTVLPADRRPALAAALRRTATAPACTTPATRFALIRPVDDTAGTIYVELDGCRRVLIEPADGRPWLGRADDALAGLLA
jgi:hypothetical protein